MIKVNYRTSGTGTTGGIGCGLFIVVALINATIGGLSVDYILSWFGKNIPFLADALIGLFVGEVSIPVAIVGYLLKLLGVF